MEDTLEINRLIDEIDAMPFGSAQAELARELWSRAQKHENPRLRFKAIATALEAASFSGGSAFFLSLFPQMVRLKKEHPEAVNPDTYIWRLKWLVGKMVQFPEVPWERIAAAEDLYSSALQEVGGSQRTALYLRWQNAYNSGRMEGLDEQRETFLAMQTDEHSDCTACEVNTLVEEAVFKGDFDRMKQMAEPLVTRRMRCSEVPHLTFGNLLLPSLLHGEREAAAQYHKRGYAMIRSNVGWLDLVGHHLGYLAAVGDAERVLRLLRNHTPWVEQNQNPRHHLEFYAAAAAGLELLAGSSRAKRTPKLTLPPKLQEAWGEGLSAATLSEHFTREARQLAAAFDRRNGNAWMSNRLEEKWKDIRTLRQDAAPAASKPQAPPDSDS